MAAILYVLLSSNSKRREYYIHRKLLFPGFDGLTQEGTIWQSLESVCHWVYLSICDKKFVGAQIKEKSHGISKTLNSATSWYKIMLIFFPTVVMVMLCISQLL